MGRDHSDSLRGFCSIYVYYVFLYRSVREGRKLPDADLYGGTAGRIGRDLSVGSFRQLRAGPSWMGTFYVYRTGFPEYHQWRGKYPGMSDLSSDPGGSIYPANHWGVPDPGAQDPGRKAAFDGLAGASWTGIGC